MQSCLYPPCTQPASSLSSGQSCTLSHCFAPWMQVPSPHWNSSGWQVTRAVRQHTDALTTQDLKLLCGTFSHRPLTLLETLTLPENVTEHFRSSNRSSRCLSHCPVSLCHPRSSSLSLGKKPNTPVSRSSPNTSSAGREASWVRHNKGSRQQNCQQ